MLIRASEAHIATDWCTRGRTYDSLASDDCPDGRHRESSIRAALENAMLMHATGLLCLLLPGELPGVWASADERDQRAVRRLVDAGRAHDLRQWK